MPGTIIDSTEAIVKHWHKEAESMGVDPNVILATSHGRRSIDTFKIHDPSKANWQCKVISPIGSTARRLNDLQISITKKV